MRILLGLLSMLKNALHWTLEWCFWLAVFPFRIFAPPAGRSAVPPPPAASTEASVEPPAVTYSPSSRRMAAAAVNWCYARLRRGPDAGLPPATIPEGLRGWLMSLQAPELQLVVKAGFTALSEHISGRSQIPGLLPAGPHRPATTSAVQAGVAGETPERKFIFRLNGPEL